MSALTAAVLAASLAIAPAWGGYDRGDRYERPTCSATETPAPAPTPAPTQPAPPASPAPVGSATGGSGGALSDRTFVNFSGAGLSSNYHIYAGHIDRSKPIKLQVHLHGDGAYEAKNPGYSINKAYLETAKRTNAILVIPKTPIGDTWWRDSRASDYLAALVKDIYGDYDIHTGDVWFSGYSGGAQALSQHFIPKYHSLIKGGGVVLVGGGGVYTNNLGAAGSAIGSRFEVHYIAGSLDTGGSGSSNNGFNAYNTAKTSAPKWRSAGFTEVTLDEKRETHNEIANDGPTTLARYR